MRWFGHAVIVYIDDMLLQGDTFETCEAAVRDTVATFDNLGFTIHPDHSLFYLSKKIKILGVILDSISMIVSITQKKANKYVELCKKTRSKAQAPIKQLAELIGHLVTAQPGVWITTLFIKRLEIEKIRALNASKRKFLGIYADQCKTHRRH